MVGFTRVGRIAQNPQAAMAFAVEMTNFLKKKHGIDITCWARMGGPTGQIVWQSAFADMTALDKFTQKLQSDQEYWKKVNEAQGQGLFEAGSAEDGIWNQLA